MRLKSTVSVVLLVLFASLVGEAQTSQQPSMRSGQIRGQVRYADGRPAVMGLAVYVEGRTGGMNDQTQTDRQGKFEFIQVPPGIYVVRVRAPGYLSDSQEVDLSTIPMGYVTFVLKGDPKSPGPSVPPEGPGGALSAVDAAAPAEARKNFESGRDLLTRGKDIDKSVALFQKAISEYPQYSEAYLLMGVAYSSQKNWSDAEKALQKCIELNKNNPAALVAIGAAENEQKDYSDAEKHLTQAVALAPGSADAHFELGRAYWGLQRWSDADQHVAKANALRSDNSAQHVLMGNIMLRERNAEGALKEFKEALRLDPTGPLAEPTKQIVAKIENALNASKK
jgi:Flp pilus assembly protein TadD